MFGDRCLEPGVQDDGCPAGSLGQGDGTCQAAGIPPEGCAPGFEHDGDVGCASILPVEACPAGLMAVPGDAACRPIMGCGAGKWGDIAVDASTIHVDGTYSGADSDGSDDQPWTTVQEAIDAAPPGALVAIAAGSYAGPLRIGGDPIRLHGVCPSEVEIVATGALVAPCSPAALCILGGADGSEVRGISFRGDGRGIMMSGSEGVVLDRLWVHDVSGYGVSLEDEYGATSAVLRGSLVEAATDRGVGVASAAVTLEASVVRGTLPGLGGLRGRGVSAEPYCDPPRCGRSSVTITGSLVEQSREAGVAVMDTDATIAASVIRDTDAQESDQAWGGGIVAQVPCSSGGVCDPARRSQLYVTGSLVERNQGGGIFVIGSDATIETTVVRETRPSEDGSFGAGIFVQVVCDGGTCDTSGRGNARLVSVVVEQNHTAAVFVAGSDLSVEGSIFRHTKPRASDQRGGRGIDVGPICPDDTCDLSTTSSTSIRGSVVEGNHDTGILVMASSALVEGTIVRATAPSVAEMLHGIGIAIQVPCLPTTGCQPVRSSATIRASVLEDNHEVGLSVIGSDAVLEHDAIRRTVPVGGLYGDAVAVLSPFDPGVASAATASLLGVTTEDSARAGLSSFGGAVSLQNTALKCSAFDLEGEQYAGNSFAFTDLGSNTCGCPAPLGKCTTVSTGVAPPAPALAE